MVDLLRKSTVLLLAVLFLSLVPALTAQTAAANSTAPAFQPMYPGVQPDDLLPETQFQIHERGGYTGMVWWIPTEFWLLSAEAHGRPMSADFKTLDNYTTVAIFVAKVGDLGNFDFATGADLRKNVVLRDADGNEYPPLEEVSSVANSLKGILKPMLAGAMGKVGENMEIIYYPALDKKGHRIASPTSKGQFSFVLRNTLGMKEQVILAATPLTALSPAKYCPIDHRKMTASWSFCPWHGVALDDKSVAAPAAPAKK